jgi:hypothetical protein
MEIVQTKYAHPEIKSGAHANGPPTAFIRKDRSSPWFAICGIRNRSEIARKLHIMGLQAFLSVYGERVQ